ncbi:hypothetical protein K3M68_01405 [Streptococcus dysgalactiae subsp. dysgalactiae]|uniref:hyaluronate lyase N-terminal domain-containing protein n=1 Tax=Streptococcus dysgalactiae TaxID=1334 RepID=UPI001CF4EA7A|nr:hypothetical protein [Streptococcus dysgalactiae]MCB2832719.1 hypothetical protein [Streptococcus dysgalactiae subsp. dysgalactiae]
MAENIPLRVQFKRMTAEEWARSDVILLEGEIGFETDTGFAKFGNGKNQFKDLKYLQGPRGDKGDSITISEQQKTADGLQLTFSDKTQVTIPKGDKGDSVKGDKGNSVTSARVDESGNFYVTIEGQSEKLLGNIKGGKGDKGDPLKFEDLTPDQIAQIKAKDVDLSVYATKDDLNKVDVSKQLADLVKTGDIADVVRKPDLTAYATKDELKKVSIGQAIPTFTTSYQYDNSYLRSYSESGYRGTWSVNEDASKLIPGDIIALEVTNTSYYNKNYIIATVVSSTRSTITSLSRELAQDKPSDTTFLSQKEADKIYATKKHKHEIDDINGLQATLNNKAGAQHSHSEYLEQATADRLYLAKGTLPRDVVTSDTLAGYLAGYARVADIKSQLDNIGKLKDTKSGQFLDVMVVDKGQTPRDTTGMIVFERA